MTANSFSCKKGNFQLITYSHSVSIFNLLKYARIQQLLSLEGSVSCQGMFLLLFESANKLISFLLHVFDKLQRFVTICLAKIKVKHDLYVQTGISSCEFCTLEDVSLYMNIHKKELRFAGQEVEDKIDFALPLIAFYSA